MILAVALTIIMGLTRQVPSGMPAGDPLGFRYMLTSWPFVLLYIYMAVIIFQAVLKELSNWRWKAFPALVFHIGLLSVLLAGTMGSADMHMLEMKIEETGPEWRAADKLGHVQELPLAIQLLDFDIQRYPPKLLLTDSLGAPLANPAQTLEVDSSFTKGTLGPWTVNLEEYIELGAPAGGLVPDGRLYTVWPSSGAVTAVRIKACTGSEVREGWVAEESYRFAGTGLPLGENAFIFMGQSTPRRFQADIRIFTEKGGNYRTRLAVNEPFTIDGWKIYLDDYDTVMGRWSETATLQLVKDPWMPAVYAGIFLMLLGAILILFVRRN